MRARSDKLVNPQFSAAALRADRGRLFLLQPTLPLCAAELPFDLLPQRHKAGVSGLRSSCRECRPDRIRAARPLIRGGEFGPFGLYTTSTRLRPRQRLSKASGPVSDSSSEAK